MAPTSTLRGNAGSRRPATKTREQELEAQVAQLQSDLKSITETFAKPIGEKANEVQDIAETELRHSQEPWQAYG